MYIHFTICKANVQRSSPYVFTKDSSVHPPDLAYVCLRGLVFGFYFLIVQSVIWLTLRVLGLIKASLLKTFVDSSYRKGFAK
jgi:hypothetical protein